MSKSYPRQIRIEYPASPTMTTDLLVFVEEGGVRLDNAGPLPPAAAKRLRDWLTRYLNVAETGHA